MRAVAIAVAVMSVLIAGCGQPAASTHAAAAAPSPPPGGWTQPDAPVARPAAAAMSVVGNPARMLIPSINVDAAVEHVGFLDIPRDPNDVAWFNRAPGESGTATFDGHLDWIGFKPAVFWDLGKLHTGDEIDIVGADGTRQAWVIDYTESVSYTSQPPDWLYASSGPPRISLITCDGSWTGNIYSNRLLVRAIPAPQPRGPARYY